MDALLEFKGAVDLRGLGLPAARAPDGRVRVSAPAWGEQQLTQYLVNRFSGVLTSLETIPSSTHMGGCKCLGRR